MKNFDYVSFCAQLKMAEMKVCKLKFTEDNNKQIIPFVL